MAVGFELGQHVAHIVARNQVLELAAACTACSAVFIARHMAVEAHIEEAAIRSWSSQQHAQHAHPLFVEQRRSAAGSTPLCKHGVAMHRSHAGAFKSDATSVPRSGAGWCKHAATFNKAQPTIGIAVHAIRRVVGLHQAQHAANVGLRGKCTQGAFNSIQHAWLACIDLSALRMLVRAAQGNPFHWL